MRVRPDNTILYKTPIR